MFCDRSWAEKNLPLSRPCLCMSNSDHSGQFCSKKHRRKTFSSNCVHGMEVMIPNGKSYCQCYTGYYGRNCEIRVTPGLSAKQAANCLWGDFNFAEGKCTCWRNATGPDCDKPIYRLPYANSVEKSSLLTIGLPILIVIIGAVVTFLFYLCCLGRGRLRRQISPRDQMTSRVHNFLASREGGRRRSRRNNYASNLCASRANPGREDNGGPERPESAPPSYDDVVEKPPSYVTAMRFASKNVNNV